MELSETAAPELLAVLRFLRDSPGSEALGISYGAAYLKAVPAPTLTAEPFDAIAQMAERLADQASGSATLSPTLAAHLEVVEQFGIRMRNFERNGRMQVCYDGELFRRVLTLPGPAAEERARAVLGLTRARCIDPDLGPAPRASARHAARAAARRDQGAGIERRMTRSRLHARRAGGLGLDCLRAGAARRAAAGARRSARSPSFSPCTRMISARTGGPSTWTPCCASARSAGRPWTRRPDRPLTLSAVARRSGPDVRRALSGRPPHLERRWSGAAPTGSCGWPRHARIAEGPALVLAVQPLESWRELWVFHEEARELDGRCALARARRSRGRLRRFCRLRAGHAAPAHRARSKDRGRFRRRFEELRLDDLASGAAGECPELLRDFGRWQDVAWRRDTLALH